MTSAKVRYGDGTMGDVRFDAGKTPGFGARVPPTGDHTSLARAKGDRLLLMPVFCAILASTLPRIRQMSAHIVGDVRYKRFYLFDRVVGIDLLGRENHSVANVSASFRPSRLRDLGGVSLEMTNQNCIIG
jgi:hypothetical protein